MPAYFLYSRAMSLDPLFLEAVVGELRDRLRNAAVSKIHQPGAHELVLRLWTGRENLRLLLSVDPRASRLHLATAHFPNPQTPPRFCQLLRARLLRLLDIERLPGERIVHLRFSGEEGRPWSLMAEFLGARSNLILLDDEGKIVDSLLRQEGEVREILPGRPYVAPLQPVRFDLEQRVPSPPQDQSLRPWLLAQVTPMTPLLAADIEAAAAAGIPPGQALERFAVRWRARAFQPAVVTWQGQPQLTALLPEFLELSEVRLFAAPSLAAEQFYAATAGEAAFASGPQELARLVRKQGMRLEKRLQQIAAEEEKARHSERQRELGDLLLANLHRLRRGMTTIEVEDWYADPPVAVSLPLDPALTPQQNAERYFRLHRKAKRAQEHVVRRRSETLAELEWLDNVLQSLEEARTPAELAAIRDELAEAGVLKVRPEPGRRPRTAGEEPLRRAATPGGFQLLWGKNNRSNDQVSCRLTAADDLWFHAHRFPGCHLVLKRGGRGGEIPEADLLFAASLAAGYSRGKDSAKVEVSVSEGRWVKKPPGARSGLVTVEHYRTVVVAPRRLDDAAE